MNYLYQWFGNIHCYKASYFSAQLSDYVVIYVGLPVLAIPNMCILCCLTGCEYFALRLNHLLERIFMSAPQCINSFRYPDLFTILLRSVDVWADCGDAITPIMKLLVELCQNRQQRLQYEMASCSAVLLFREVSKIICTYGETDDLFILRG